jgi:hypothetical protein
LKQRGDNRSESGLTIAERRPLELGASGVEIILEYR